MSDEQRPVSAPANALPLRLDGPMSVRDASGLFVGSLATYPAKLRDYLIYAANTLPELERRLERVEAERDALRRALERCQSLAALHTDEGNRLTALETTARIAGVARRALVAPTDGAGE